MNVNYTININSFKLSTASTVSIPIDIKYQIVDNDELIQNVFVNNAVKKSINCILDYDKAKFIPVDSTNKEVVYIVYKINLIDSSTGNYYSPNTSLLNLGYLDSDLGFNTNSFKNSFFFLQFYDSFNPQTKNFATESQMYNYIDPAIAIGTDGLLKSVSLIPAQYTASNPKIVTEGYYTCFNVYDDIQKYTNINTINSLYCSAHLFNAKTGKVINFMTTNQTPTIEDLPKKQYMKYDLKRVSKGFTYTIDTSFNNNSSPNVTFQNLSGTLSSYKQITIDLYEVRVS